MSNRLETRLGEIVLKNPVMPASGTFGFGMEMSRWYDLNVLGAISLKGTTGEERFGNPTPRIAECREGMLNAVGLQNPGVDAVVAHELPQVRAIYDGVLLANISGFSIDEYVMVAEKFDKAPEIDILEINISCPNVRHGGMAFGTDPAAAEEVTRAVKAVTHKPVFMKLSPNVTDIAAIAKACAQGGADGITLINTLLGMVIDPRTGRPIVSTKMSGFSGPAIKPIALRMVYQVAQAVDLPIIGVGGISTADDVIEFMSAGASAIQVGAQNLVDPFACPKIIRELPEKLDAYGIGCVQDIIGRSLKF